MEYESLIRQILEAERNAREITREAREKESHMDADLEQETAAVRAECFAQSEQRLEELRRETEQHKAEELQAQDRRVAEMLERMEQAYSRYGDNWVDTLFRETVYQR